MHDWGIVHGDLKGVCVATLHLLAVPLTPPQGQHNDRRNRLCHFGRLQSSRVDSGPIDPAVHMPGGWHDSMDESGAPRPRRIRFTEQTANNGIGLLCTGDGDLRSSQWETPFSPSGNPFLKILRGIRPERPQGAQGAWFTDDIWGMLGLCWKPQPSERISAKTVLLCLERNSPQLDDDQSDAGSMISLVRFLCFISGSSLVTLVGMTGLVIGFRDGCKRFCLEICY